MGSPRSLGGGEGESNKVYYGECASYKFVLIPLDFASLFKSGFQLSLYSGPMISLP